MYCVAPVQKKKKLGRVTGFWQDSSILTFNQSSKRGFMLWWHKILVFLPLSLPKIQPLQPAILRSGNPSSSYWCGISGSTELTLNIVTIPAKIHVFFQQNHHHLYFLALITGAIVLSNALIAHRNSVEGASTCLVVKYDTVSFTSSLISVFLQKHQAAHSWFLSCDVTLNKNASVSYTWGVKTLKSGLLIFL